MKLRNQRKLQQVTQKIQQKKNERKNCRRFCLLLRFLPLLFAVDAHKFQIKKKKKNNERKA